MPGALMQIATDLSDEAREILHVAARKAEEHVHSSMGASHLLWALLYKSSFAGNLASKLGKDIFYLQEWTLVRLEEYPKAGDARTKVDFGPEVGEILLEADQIRFELNREEVDPECMLAALCTPGLAYSFDQLKTFTLSKEEILANIRGGDDTSDSGHSSSADTFWMSAASDDSALHAYCFNKNRELGGKNNFRLVERQEELKTCLEILSRYTRANLIIKGEPGVGKTALVNGLAQEIKEGKVPDNLLEASLFELDLAALQAGTSYRGEIEDRFQKILGALGRRKKPILIVEDIHALLDKNRNFSSLAGLLNLELNRGEVTVIGTTTPENFRKLLEKDDSFIRRFETLALEEPDDEAAAHIIRTVIAAHEEHHRLIITDDGIREAIRLSRRYDKNRLLPDAAVDLIDRSMARVRIAIDQSKAAYAQLKKAYAEYNESRDVTALSQVRKHYAAFYEISRPLLKARYDVSLKKESGLGEKEDFLTYLNKDIPRTVKRLEDPPDKIKSSDLAEVISRKTGIPTGKIQTRERKRLLDMETVLRGRVVGQDSAINSVAEAILESRSGLLKGECPIGSFFFLGPTGTGKTELAKALSEFLFQKEQAMIRFDMSEFKEEHSAALLHGAPPGYAGYEEGGILVNKIRENPYAVVLFDEIEKAHPSVYDIFLQILDEGRLNDRLGKEGDFSNAVILFTSNAASDHITDCFNEKGEPPDERALREILSKYFRPEFLGRLTEIVPFAPIGEEVLLRILEINLNELLQLARRKGISVEVDLETKKYLAQLGYSPQYGARPLKGVIRDKVRKPLSRLIIEERVGSGDKVRLSLEEDHQIRWKY